MFCLSIGIMLPKILAIISVLFTANIDGAKFRFDYKFSKDADGWLKLQPVPAVWSDARLRCHAEGAVLASPLNEKLRGAIIDYTLQEMKTATLIYSGIHATLSNGDYASVEGVPLSRLCVRWAAGEPDNRDNAERCLAMDTTVNGSLSDVSCARTLPYVCYKKKAPLVVTSCGTHDPGYVLEPRTGSCYKFHTRGLVWARAYMTCAAEGAYLAIINSHLESQALKDLYKKHPDKTILSENPHIASIGFLDWQDGGSWMTIHGQTLSEAGFDTWEANMPDNNTRAPNYSFEFCGSVLRSGKLNDVACDITLPFICEKKPDSLQDKSDEQDC